jgi:peroxiredoxin
MGTRLRAIAVVVGLAAFAVSSADRTLARQSAPPPSPEVTALLQQGETALARRQYEPALGAFTQANKLQNKTSALAMYGMARAFQGMEAYKSAVDACAEALKYVGTDKKLETLLHNQRGLAFIKMAQKPTDKAFRDAEAEFRGVLVATEAMPVAWFNLGVVLLKQNRDAEGVQALQTFLDTGVKSVDTETAKYMIEEPRRARENFAPEFSATSLDGEYISLKELRGKVVLLDFWGTWCPPCVAASPMVVNMAKQFSKDPNFTIIGISSDSRADAGKLKDFIAEKKMTWPEIHDITGKVIPLYDVHNYPTYIVIDGEGIIREWLKGYDPTETRAKLDRAITNALKDLKALKK